MTEKELRSTNAKIGIELIDSVGGVPSEPGGRAGAASQRRADWAPSELRKQLP